MWREEEDGGDWLVGEVKGCVYRRSRSFTIGPQSSSSLLGRALLTGWYIYWANKLPFTIGLSFLNNSIVCFAYCKGWWYIQRIFYFGVICDKYDKFVVVFFFEQQNSLLFIMIFYYFSKYSIIKLIILEFIYIFCYLK